MQQGYHNPELSFDSLRTFRPPCPFFIFCALALLLWLFPDTAFSTAPLTQAHYRWRADDGGENNSGTTSPTVSSATSGTAVNTNSITFSHTVSGVNRLLLVGTTARLSGTGTQPRVQTVTWKNGTESFTYGNSRTSGVPNAVIGEIWKLVAPSTGTYNIVVTFDLNCYATAGAVSFSGVDQTTPLGTIATRGSTSPPQYVNVATAVGDIAFGIVMSYSLDQTSRTATDVQWNTNPTNGYSEGVTTTASGTTTQLSWGASGGSQHAALGVAVKGLTAAITWPVVEDTKIGIRKLETKRLRFLVSNTSGGAFQCYYVLKVAQSSTCASGSYEYFSGIDTWEMVASSYFAEGDPTTNVSPGLTDPGGYTFVAGQILDTNPTTNPAINLNASQFSEVEILDPADQQCRYGRELLFFDRG